MNAKVEELAAAVADLRARIRSATEDLGSSQAGEELHAAIDLAAEELGEAQTKLEAAVRRNPLLALASAAAIGYLLGSAFSRR